MVNGHHMMCFHIFLFQSYDANLNQILAALIEPDNRSNNITSTGEILKQRVRPDNYHLLITSPLLHGWPNKK